MTSGMIQLAMIKRSLLCHCLVQNNFASVDCLLTKASGRTVWKSCHLTQLVFQLESSHDTVQVSRRFVWRETMQMLKYDLLLYLDGASTSPNSTTCCFSEPVLTDSWRDTAENMG